MWRRLSLLTGVLLALAGLWLFLQRPPARGGDRRPQVPLAERDGEAAVPVLPSGVEPPAAGRAPRLASEPGAAAATAPEPAPTPRHSLRVRVTDDAGRPHAGIPVRVVLESGSRPGPHVHRATTGEEGLAEFPSLDGGQFEAAAGLALRVALDGLFEPPVEASFPAEPWPSEPLELRLPAAGALVVSVLDEHGQPLANGKRDVELRLARELQAGARIWRERAQVSSPIEDGVARFPAVGLGLACTASYDDRPDHPRAELELAGPTRPGEELHAELRLVPPEGSVALRLLAPDLVPLASAPVEVSSTKRVGGGSVSSVDTLTTDAEGRLVVPVREGWSEGQERLLGFVHSPSAGPECEAEVDLSRELAPGTSELGDVVLRARPVLVAGRAVDADGNGVAASLQVQQRHGEGENEYWGHVTSAQADADGRFAVYHAAPDTPVRLEVDSAEHQPIDPIPFAPGTTGLEVVLRRGVALHGSVRAPEGMSPLAFEVSARGASERDQRTTAVSAAGTFELAGLAPGTYDVEFTLRPTSASLLVLSAVQAHGGEDDPRLASVDLRALARGVRLTVRASDGSLAPGGWVHVLGGDWQQVAFVIEGGAAEVLVPAVGSDVEVSVPGHRALFLDGLAADREVRLEPAFRVRCELAPAVSLPEDGALQLRLVASGDPRGGGSHYSLYRAHEQVGWFSNAFGDEGNTFDLRRALEVAAPGPGTYEVVFHLVLGSADGGRLSYSIPGGGANARITLDERSAGATFVVEPGPEYARRLAGE